MTARGRRMLLHHAGANFVRIISVASAKSCAIQSAELSAVFVSKPVRTRIALIPALCPQCTSISLSPTIMERLRSTACSRAPCKDHSGRGFAAFRVQNRGHRDKRRSRRSSGSPNCRSTSAWTRSYCSPCEITAAASRFDSSPVINLNPRAFNFRSDSGNEGNTCILAGSEQ